jgi:uncharacterized protein
MVFENEHIEVKDSKIEGLGVFAKHDFKKGEVIFKWKPIKTVTDENRASIPEYERDRYITFLDDETEVLMGIPERYVNHSCDPNTNAIDGADVAVRDIKTGEEITADYKGEHLEFQCKGCGSPNCKA